MCLINTPITVENKPSLCKRGTESVLGVPSDPMSAAHAVILHGEFRAHVRLELQLNSAAGPFLLKTRNTLWFILKLTNT